MAQSMLFARARPEVIYLTETYTYRVSVSNVTYVEPGVEREGLVEVVIPYDGWDYFTRQALKDIENQIKPKQQPDRREARVGHIGFSNYDYTDLDEKYNLSLKHNTLPVDVPIQSSGFRWPDSLKSDRHEFRMDLPYTPETMEASPLSIEVRIIDEVEMEEREEMRRDVELDEDILKKVARNIIKKMGFEYSLDFRFKLTLSLPSYFPIKYGEMPKLVHMELAWPVTTSYSLVKLHIDGERGGERTVIYNPEEKTIQWSQIDFVATEDSKERNEITYHTPPFSLRIREPGELYHLSELTGRIRILIPGLCSGLRVYYFDGLGVRDKSFPVESCTFLEMKLTLFLQECFEKRNYSPYQHLQFPNIILDEMRRADIMMLLRDEGFRCVTNEPRKLPDDTFFDEIGAGSGNRYLLIEANRPEGVGELKLWILLQGTPSETTRERKILGRETFTTAFGTGHTEIYIRGQLQGDSKRVVAVINHIHEQLKERFRHISTID